MISGAKRPRSGSLAGNTGDARDASPLTLETDGIADSVDPASRQQKFQLQLDTLDKERKAVVAGEHPRFLERRAIIEAARVDSVAKAKTHMDNCIKSAQKMYEYQIYAAQQLSENACRDLKSRMVAELDERMRTIDCLAKGIAVPETRETKRAARGKRGESRSTKQQNASSSAGLGISVTFPGLGVIAGGSLFDPPTEAAAAEMKEALTTSSIAGMTGLPSAAGAGSAGASVGVTAASTDASSSSAGGAGASSVPGVTFYRPLPPGANVQNNTNTVTGFDGSLLIPSTAVSFPLSEREILSDVVSIYRDWKANAQRWKSVAANALIPSRVERNRLYYGDTVFQKGDPVTVFSEFSKQEYLGSIHMLSATEIIVRLNNNSKARVLLQHLRHGRVSIYKTNQAPPFAMPGASPTASGSGMVTPTLPLGMGMGAAGGAGAAGVSAGLPIAAAPAPPHHPHASLSTGPSTGFPAHATGAATGAAHPHPHPHPHAHPNATGIAGHAVSGGPAVGATAAAGAPRGPRPIGVGVGGMHPVGARPMGQAIGQAGVAQTGGVARGPQAVGGMTAGARPMAHPAAGSATVSSAARPAGMSTAPASTAPPSAPPSAPAQPPVAQAPTAATTSTTSNTASATAPAVSSTPAPPASATSVEGISTNASAEPAADDDSSSMQ